MWEYVLKLRKLQKSIGRIVGAMAIENPSESLLHIFNLSRISDLLLKRVSFALDLRRLKLVVLFLQFRYSWPEITLLPTDDTLGCLGSFSFYGTTNSAHSRFHKHWCSLMLEHRLLGITRIQKGFTCCCILGSECFNRSSLQSFSLLRLLLEKVNHG